MNVSLAAVHPAADLPANGPDLEGMPAKRGGLALRLSQFILAVAALAIMASTSDFPSVTAFCCCLAEFMELFIGCTRHLTLSVMRSVQNHRIVCLFTIGDGIRSTLTFAATCASAGITVLIDNDLGCCSQNHCVQFETTTAMAFIGWFSTLPSFFNFWSLASRQRCFHYHLCRHTLHRMVRM